MTGHSKFRLGKRPRRHDVRTLKLARYLTPGLPAPPSRVDWTLGATDWGLMLNDRLGCCTIAAVGHAVQAWRLNAQGDPGTTNPPLAAQGSPPAISDSTILQYYESWDGYDPAQPVSDQGGVELDVLNHWRQQGFGGHTLEAYTAIELSGSAPATQQDPKPAAQPSEFPISGPQPPAATAQLAAAIWLFGGAYVGVELPLRAQDQDVWDVAANPGLDDVPGSWGGHAVYLVGYEFGDPPLGGISSESSAKTRPPAVCAPGPTSSTPYAGSITCITWGRTKKMTWAWFDRYCSEAYALVSKDWIETSGLAPSGFDLQALENDLKLVVS
jgi:hypothetical protein